MGELMRPMPFDQIMRWALGEYRQQGSIFGLSKGKIFRPGAERLTILNAKISSAIGPAAGPHTQLAQNLITAYLAGGRFFELKTVQKIDGAELRSMVPKPCINAQDEGYNVEWSSELTVPQAFDEYVKAWLALHVLGIELGLSDTRDFIFNMSVGYDLAGIQTKKINSFIEEMKDASNTPVFQQGLRWLLENLHFFSRLKKHNISEISPSISNSITLSTLHGCPATEIEKIAQYLMTEKQLHTYIKCNPTLLGYDTVRRLLDQTGYTHIQFDHHHFEDDLQYQDALQVSNRLLNISNINNLEFGLKLTNTFPVYVQNQELPGKEMYLSGRALLPLSIHLAAQFSRDFEGLLPISYSGGADAFNVPDILQTGIRPLTVATTALKPGGYERFQQLALSTAPHLSSYPTDIDAPSLSKLAERLLAIPYYHKGHRAAGSRKTSPSLQPFDCFMAPCMQGGCPIEQQIPAYLAQTAEGHYKEAFQTILVDNALPSVTSVVCNHACQGKCTRTDYDTSLSIRNLKHIAVQNAQEGYTNALSPPRLKTGQKVAVVGAGAAGLAAAFYLRRNGVAVTVYEKQHEPLGIVRYVIPTFRISEKDLRADFNMAVNMGVEFVFDSAIKDPLSLLKDYNYVIIAVGAWKKGHLTLQKGQEDTLDALSFLQESKKARYKVPLGKTVSVIGGGNVAVDCARAALRAPEVQEVTLVYRRTRQFMPAEKEEIHLAIAEGVKITELHTPLSYDGYTLRCERTQLGRHDESGRRCAVGTGQTADLCFESVICATGAQVETSLFNRAQIALDAKGLPLLNTSSLESSQGGIYVAGDCRKGPATVVAAMADAKTIAKDILQKMNLPHDFVKIDVPLTQAAILERKGRLQHVSECEADGRRCLGCDTLCEICCEVCPNRANISLPVSGFEDSAQILHLDGLCNECGNCGTFCPHSGNPYKDKMTLYWTREDFENSSNVGFLKTENGQYILRIKGQPTLECTLDSPDMPQEWARMIHYIEQNKPYVFG